MNHPPGRCGEPCLIHNAGVSRVPPDADRLRRFAELRDEGLTLRQICERTGSAYRTVTRLSGRYRAERGGVS